MKKKIIIISILIIALIFGVAIFLVVNNESENEDKVAQDLSWEEVYIDVLSDKDEFEDLEDIKIQLVDLDYDQIPELAVYGFEEVTDYVAKIYKFKDKNAEEYEIELDDEFDLKYMYNINNEEFNWYAVTKEENKVYDFDFKDDDIAKASDLNYENDFVVVEENISQKVEFDNNLDKKEIENIFESAKETYVANEEMVTEDVNKKVETAKVIKNIKKVDNTKGIVYSGLEYECESYANVIDETFYYHYKYPVINIDSNDVKEMNEDIKLNYGFDKENQEELPFMELEVITYNYYINENTLSLVVLEGGNDSTWSSSYNVDLENLAIVDIKELLNSVDTDEVKKKFKEFGYNRIDNDLKEMNSIYQADWYDEYVTEWKADLDKNLENFDNVYLNEDGDICIRTTFETFGGQEYCTKTIEINATKMSEVKEIKFEDYFIQEDEVAEESTTKETSTNNTSSNSETTDLANYLGKDIVSSANELGFEKGTYLSIPEERNGISFYTYPTNTTVAIKDEFDGNGIVDLVAVRSSDKFSIYGLKCDMTYEEVENTLNTVGLKEIRDVGNKAYSVTLNNGDSMALNFVEEGSTKKLNDFTAYRY